MLKRHLWGWEMARRYIYQAMCIGISTLGVSACSNHHDFPDLKAYSDKVMQDTKATNIQALPEIKLYQMPKVDIEGLRNPFETPLQLKAKQSAEKNTSSSQYKPDLSRVKKALEKVPLANLDFVGVIHQDGQLWAIITNNNTGEVFTVKVGEYLGENYGRVQKITDNAIQIDERVQDAKGNWSKKLTVLPLHLHKEDEDEKESP